MTSFGESNILLAVGWAVFNSLWQMAILWVAYQFISTTFRINKSSQRGFLSVFLLFSGFLWFVYTLVTGLASNNSGTQGYASLLSVEGNSALGSWLSTMLPLASLLYLVLLVLPVLNFIRNYRYVQVIRRYGLSRAGVQMRMFVQRTASQMGIPRQVHVWMSDLITSPVTIGYIKPVILLPVAAINHLTTQQIEAVILHELAHIRRYDYFINLITKFIQAILYFNPFVKAFAKIIDREREKSCDETVMQFQYEPHGYASALLVLEKAAHVARHSLTVAASDGKKGEFRQRIEWILGIRKKQSFSYNRLAAVLAAFLFFIALNALVIISKPQKTSSAQDSFSLLSLPLHFSGEENNVKEVPVVEKHAEPVYNLPSSESIAEEPSEPQQNPEALSAETEELKANSNQSIFSFVSNLQNVMPKLSPIEEKQVQEALIESKKVMQEIKWKEVETSIADAMTQAEKSKIEVEVKKALAASADMAHVGDKLRLAYKQIDWNMVNVELKNELAYITLDSLHNVYSIALDEICDLQKELIKEKQTCIPDTDITLESIELKKVEIQRVIKKIASAKPRKIIKL
jgi:beta-lactamase regulating signal transducer with metallopeptidase domain